MLRAFCSAMSFSICSPHWPPLRVCPHRLARVRSTTPPPSLPALPSSAAGPRLLDVTDVDLQLMGVSSFADRRALLRAVRQQLYRNLDPTASFVPSVAAADEEGDDTAAAATASAQSSAPRKP